MVGIRRTDGAAGCVPTETPNSDYANPFRVDSGGALWIRECFEEFKYFGAARHDVPTGIRWIGSDACPVDDPTNIRGAKGIPTGSFKNVTVTNNTQEPMQLLLGIDAVADIICNISRLVVVSLITRWNGEYQSSTGTSLPNSAFTNRTIRQMVNFSANPHDQLYEDQVTTYPDSTATPGVLLQPGESGTVSAKLSIAYWDGKPDGRDVLVSASSAVRVYGHAF